MNTTLDIGGKQLKISNPDKKIFTNPILTKADIVEYYTAVSGRMLPYLNKRLVSVIRCPNGIENGAFFKKHPEKSADGIVIVPVTNSNGERKDYFYIESLYGLISEVQMNTVEFHIWGSSTENIEKPDIMVFDLDPDLGMDIERVRQGVRDTKSLLDELELKSFLKVSGGKGYHIVVPFVPSALWDTFENFSRQIAFVMEKKWPDRYTTNIRKEKRKGKIFIDWIRNGRGATSVAPYSLRARKGAAVSMPIEWGELDRVEPNSIGIKQAIARLKEPDPWADFFVAERKNKVV